MKYPTALLLMLIVPNAMAASVQSVTVSLSDSLSATSPAVAKLRSVKVAAEAGKTDACLKEAAAAVKSAKDLEPWLLTIELECSEKLSIDKKNGDRLNAILVRADSKQSMMAFGPWSMRLRSAWAKAHLAALEMDLKFNRVRAWSHVEKLSTALTLTPSGKAVLDDPARARVWRIAGELLFLNQKSEGAREFFRRSLAEVDQPDLRDRLKVLDAAAPSGEVATGNIPTLKLPDGTQGEIELGDRITAALKTGDLVAAGEDAVKMIREYPGGNRAKWAADRLIESLISVAEKSGEKFQPVRESLLSMMEKSDPDRVSEWARVLFNRGLWAESARLGRAAAEKLPGTRSTKVLELAMDAAYAIDDFKRVRSIGEELMEKHAGTASARLAGLRLGLVAFREQDFARAAAIFEKLIATQSSETFELQARYWLWRSLERSQNSRARAEGDEIARRYPFSYYGLRARIENAGGKIEWAKENPRGTQPAKIEHRVWMTQEEKLSWERALVLVSAGWFDEAQAELKSLPEPVTPDEKAVRAKIFATAKNYLQASKFANDAWDIKFELRRPELMRVAWPNEFRDVFETTAKKKDLDPLLTRSLTKQESGYFTKAVSSSNALGLMQMIPPTAREIADDLRLGKLNLPDDMFEPNRNIQMGTHYIAKMLNQFKGHVPLALAAYNAGPTRLDRWLKSRPTMQGIETTRTSAPEKEIWMDEFPYAETSFYVKAILRNILLYQIVEEGSVTLQEPLWKSVSATPRPSSGSAASAP